MKSNSIRRILSLLLCVIMVMALALSASGCSKKAAASEPASVTESVASTASEVTVLGDGAVMFTFTVVNEDGSIKTYEIHTDDETVGAALLSLGLVDGEDSEYGLYVKTVDGTTLDYNTDGKYWAFYINDEYASTGVDSTNVEAGAVYSFRAE